MGVQPCPLPTAILSAQTGYPSYYLDDYTDKMEYIRSEWEELGAHFDGIYTGFVASEAQIDRIFDFLDTFRKEDTFLLVDPVMGDDGAVYPIYTEELRDRFCELTRRSYVITPNLTEALLLLCGKEKMEEVWKELQKAPEARRMEEIREIGCRLARKFSLPAVVITGVDHREEGQPLKMGNLVLENGNSSWVFAEKSGGSYSGTGDLFASVLSAGLVKKYSMKTCAELAVDFISASIRDAVEEGTDRNDGVCFEKHLGMLLP